jgi:phosphoribosylglycinamide formyltransferase-1
VFASGSGSNLEAILNAIEGGTLVAQVALVVSNKAGVRALERAAQRSIPTLVLAPDSFDSETTYLETLQRALATNTINVIALAGYMKKIPAALVQAYRHRMLNIHPSLLPAFGGPGMYGLNVHRAVVDRGVRWSGATVHLVDEQYDNGPIVLQKPVPVHQTDTPETLAARVLAIEHHLYPEALRLFAEGRIRVTDRKVSIDPELPTKPEAPA